MTLKFGIISRWYSGNCSFFNCSYN